MRKPRLISTFVVRCLDSIISLISISEKSKPLASCCGCAGRFESYLVENPEYRFSRDEAQMSVLLLSSHVTLVSVNMNITS